MTTKKGLTRRQAVGAAGAAGVAYVAGVGRGPLRGLVGDTPAAAAATSCSLTPEMTEGPYWVDERLNRADVRANADGTGAQTGVPLHLTIQVLDAADGCSAVTGAVVDIWHANASGVYSDEAVQGSSGTNFLRGYQTTGSDGKVSFLTVYPGWYRGRAIHIHVRVRVFDGSSATYNFTTQLFFDDSLTDAVDATSAYSARGTRDTRNAADSIYSADSDHDGAADGAEMIVALTGSTAAGYAGQIALGLSGLPATGDDTPTTSSDSTVGAALRSRAWTRTRTGRRVLHLELHAGEPASARAKLLRAGKVLARAHRASMRTGTRHLRVAVPRHVAPGPARLTLVLKDGAGNDRTVHRHVHVPRRLRRAA